MKDEPEEYVYNLSPLPFLLFLHERLFPILRRGVSKSVLWSFLSHDEKSMFFFDT